MKPRVVWMRRDGAVRIVFVPAQTVKDKWMSTHSQLVVEGRGSDALGNEIWDFASAEMGGYANLEAYALALMGEPLTKHHGFAGELIK